MSEGSDVTSVGGTASAAEGGPRRLRRGSSVLVALALVAGVLAIEFARGDAGAEVQGLPAGFTDTVVMSGLTSPTVIEFGEDGRLWIAEKSGLIKVYDGFADATPTVFADLRTATNNFWDRGLLGMTLDADFPARPYVYVMYTYDKQPGNPSVPRWGVADATEDYCPEPPGANVSGCVVMGRLSRLTVGGGGSADTMVPGSEQVLVENWCDQFPSHSVGTVRFGPDGYLYATGGDGSTFFYADYGQYGGTGGVPVNPCQDPGGGTLAGAGGSLRSQSIRNPAAAGADTAFGGSVIRIDPDTGAAAPGNPFESRANENERKVIAHGLRNPYRFIFRPGTDEIWAGDVGWNEIEEIDRFSVGDTLGGTAPNFGWPCYEGTPPTGGYSSLGTALCDSLYAAGADAVVPPYFAYSHQSAVVAGDDCQVSPTPYASAISGLAFYGGGNYPDVYDDALFFTDFNRKCLWVMKKGSDGLPDPSQISRFAKFGQVDPADWSPPDAAADLLTGPDGDLFWVDVYGGKIHRISYDEANTTTTTSATSSTTTTVPATTTTVAPSTTVPPPTTVPQSPKTGFAALPHATQVAIIDFLAAVIWAKFLDFCRAVVKAQKAQKAKAVRRSR